MSERVEINAYNKLIEAATDYLRAVGAKPAVIGGAGIMPHVDLPLNHYLTVKWTGTLPPYPEGEDDDIDGPELLKLGQPVYEWEDDPHVPQQPMSEERKR